MHFLSRVKTLRPQNIAETPALSAPVLPFDVISCQEFLLFFNFGVGPLA